MPSPNDDHEKAKLISQHLERASVHACWIATQINGLETAEVISVAHLALVEAAHRYDDRGHAFWTYARYRIEGAVRDLARRQLFDAIAYREECAYSPDDQLERRIWIAQLLAELPARDRRILTAYHLKGRTLRQIAQTLGLTEARVSQLKRRALSDLRERLRERIQAVGLQTEAA